MDWDLILGLTTAGGLGGVVANLVSGTPERRRARGRVREALLDLQAATPPWFRASSPTAAEDTAFDAALRRFQIEAQVAGVPRQMTKDFVWAVAGARTIAVIQAANLTMGSISGLEEWTDGHRRLVGDYLWSPARTRLTYRWQLGALRKHFGELNEAVKKQHERRRVQRERDVKAWDSQATA